MSRWLSEEAHEAYCDRLGLPEDAVPEVIEDAPTKPIPPETQADLIGLCMVCHRATACALCLECWARKEGR